MWWLILPASIILFVVVVAVHDLTQKRHAILRNYPLVGHVRFILEAFGPELRQYIVTSNDEERPPQSRRTPLDLHLGQGTGQHLRVRDGQPGRLRPRPRHHQAGGLSRAAAVG